MIPFRELKDKEDAVSAVIGVILMVAITVAIAATVYVYVSGMIGTSPQSAPNVQFVKDDINNKLTVASAEPGNLHWGDLVIVPSNGLSWANLTANGFTFNSTSDSVEAGDYISIASGASGTISIRHEDTNTLLGTWDFH